MPHISVVTSTFNRGNYLQQALASALGQRDVDLEVIVVNDGSTDNTSDVLDRLDDRRLRVLENARPSGATRGRNTGLAEASGDWVSILDDDDLWAPTKLRAQMDALEASGRSWAYTGCVHIDGRGRIISGRPPLPPEEVVRDLPVRYLIPAGISNVVWRREALDEGGLLDDRITLAADWDLSLRLTRVGPPAWVPRPLIACRQWGMNLSRHASRYKSEWDILEEKFADLLQGRRVDRGASKLYAGGQALQAGARGEALRFYLEGVMLGNWHCLIRALGVALPRSAQTWVRGHLLSDREWLREAAAWLYGTPPERP